ncbi:V-set and immunoglobulin domain-containing protein 10, partial [Tachysurus ichikawai]
GPKNMVVEVTPATSLANGTWFVVKASTIIINCSSTSFPSQKLTWIFEDLAQNENQSWPFGSKSCLHIEITNIQSEDQRNYTCLAQNLLSMKTETRRLELLVYCKAY